MACNFASQREGVFLAGMIRFNFSAPSGTWDRPLAAIETPARRGAKGAC